MLEDNEGGACMECEGGERSDDVRAHNRFKAEKRFPFFPPLYFPVLMYDLERGEESTVTGFFFIPPSFFWHVLRAEKLDQNVSIFPFAKTLI